MKAASLKELKSELSLLPASQVLDMMMQLTKHSKNNKELLTYLLFHAENQPQYIKEVKESMDALFAEINMFSLYTIKKSLRKILRLTNKYIKYTGNKQVQVELLIYFCRSVKKMRVPLTETSALGKLYLRQILKITTAVSTLHEDLQFDYTLELGEL